MLSTSQWVSQASTKGEIHNNQNELTILITLWYSPVVTLSPRCRGCRGRAVRYLSWLSSSSSGTGLLSQPQVVPYQSTRSRLPSIYHRVI